MVEYFYVTLVLCLCHLKAILRYRKSTKQDARKLFAASFPWAGFTAHTLAGGDVRAVSHSSFAAKRQLPESCEENEFDKQKNIASPYFCAFGAGGGAVPADRQRHKKPGRSGKAGGCPDHSGVTVEQ